MGWGGWRRNVRQGSAETESKTPLKESWPQPNSSSADKDVTEPFPGACFLSSAMRKQVTLATKAPARTSKAGTGCQLAGSPTAYNLWSHKTVFSAKADKLANN